MEAITDAVRDFVLECSSNSMINAFIPPGAQLLIDRSRKPVNGSIVVVLWNGRFAVRFLKKSDHNSWLVPANRKYPEIKITRHMDLEIWGVVTQIITDTEHLRRFMQ